MKLFKLCAFILFTLPVFLQADGMSTEIRAGYFYPASKTFRDIYHQGGAEFEIEQTFAVDCNIDFWANFGYFRRNGHSLGLDDKTSILIYPLSLGFDYNFPICEDFFFYLGAGASYTWVKIHDHSPFVKRHSFRKQFGGVAKSGFVYFFRDCLFLDVYADYYYTRVDGVHRHGVKGTGRDIGGLRTGAGLGISY